jgi:hypothetical protein
MTTLDTTTASTQAVDRQLHARVVRAAQLRAAIRDCSQLLAEAERILEAVPDGCDILLAWSDEGCAVAAAASALAADRGRRLNFERASHLVPLSPAPAETWSFVSVEQLLGLGDVRPWARRWAHDRGGRLLSTRARSELDLVA